MPLGQWDRFKLGFTSTLDEQKSTWMEIAQETLRMLDDAASLIRDADIDLTLSGELLREMHELGTEVDVVGFDYDAADSDTDRRAAVRRLEEIDDQAQLLLAQARDVVKQHLDTLKESPEGRQVIDDMIDDIDWSAGNEDDMAFGVDALKARFGITTVTGKLGHKALPRLYALMKGLPDSHTRTNDLLKVIERETPFRGGGGLYSRRDKKIVITMKRSTGRAAGDFTPDADDDVAEQFQPKEGTVPYFNHITLHEIGHAYDHSVGFMAARGKLPAYGGWEQIGSSEAAEAFATREKFFDIAGAEAVPRETMIRYLELVIDRDDHGVKAKEEWAKLVDRAAKAPGRTQVLAVPLVAEVVRDFLAWEDEGDTEHPWPDEVTLQRRADGIHSKLVGALKKQGMSGEALNGMVMACNQTACAVLLDGSDPAEAADAALDGILLYSTLTPPWDAMDSHAAAEVCRAYRDYGLGHWTLGADGAKDSSFKALEHVYTIDVGGKKFRYLFAARAFAVTKYQFNAPAEWFAELYALYFAGKIKETHPAYDLFLKDLGEPFEV